MSNVQEFAEQLQRVNELLLALRLNLTVLTTEERGTWTAITQKIESMKRPSNEEELLVGAATLKDIGDIVERDAKPEFLRHNVSIPDALSDAKTC